MRQSIVPASPSQSHNKNKTAGGILGNLKVPLLLRNKVAPTVAALAAGMQMLKAGALIAENQIPGAQALGNEFPGALFANAQYNDGTTVINYSFSGGFIGINDILALSYFVLPGHDTQGPHVSITSVGYGPSIANPTGYLPNVNLVYAGNVDLTNPSMTAGDISIYSTTFRPPNSWIHPIASSSPVQGDLLTAVSYGRVSTPSTGRLPQYDGLRLGWNATALNGSSLNVNDAYYGGMLFGSSSGISLNGGGNNGDSGAFVYNQNGKIVGPVASGNPSYTADPKATYFADYSTSEFNSQFSQYSGIIPAVPEPTNIASIAGICLAVFAALKNLRFRVNWSIPLFLDTHNSN